jgi:hypothetical protein
MNGKNNHLAQITAAGSNRIRAHPCFACLSSKRSEQRDCAVAKIVPDGFDTKRIADLYPSVKTEQ